MAAESDSYSRVKSRMASDAVIVRPKKAHKKEIHIFAKDFACPRWAEEIRGAKEAPAPTDFGGALMTVWVIWCNFGDTLALGIIMGSLWRHFGYMKVRFQKTLIFPTDFNDFT